ncbi:phage tail tape measure C-terminal domain-containing protein [Parvularcula lutaonensis]|uniref:Phage tail tape measure C-terminal domain-containing protein n=1 Tax=Parvularcula lutaonensis TaxID=491923 RepID=A0ABV7MGX2_9PROT|nr:phage tail tape measure C-terminal domain-containing protein [Parvularcula lutaonensis]GGY53218.1 hypothetical protein GCM10007148_23070 [Parvularcula lutaonensis]
MNENPPSTNDITEAATGQLEPLAALVETTFADMARNLTDELARASADGRQSISELADGIIEDLARAAAQRLIERPLENAFGQFAEEGTSKAADRLFKALMKRSARNG